ncbi:MAG: hypothetical protein C4329_04990 [Chitinophagaceae bacterium]
MKIILERILFSFQFIAHPANGWLRANNTDKSKHKSKKNLHTAPSPDSFDVRGSGKKQQSLRKNLAP